MTVTDNSVETSTLTVTYTQVRFSVANQTHPNF